MESGLPAETVERVIRMIDRNEYKRRQSAPGVRITPKAFGKDRRLPITNRYRTTVNGSEKRHRRQAGDCPAIRGVCGAGPSDQECSETDCTGGENRTCRQEPKALTKIPA